MRTSKQKPAVLAAFYRNELKQQVLYDKDLQLTLRLEQITIFDIADFKQLL